MQTISTITFVLLLAFFFAYSSTLMFSFVDGRPVVVHAANRIATTTVKGLLRYLAAGAVCILMWPLSGLPDVWLGAACAVILLGVVLSDAITFEGIKPRRKV